MKQKIKNNIILIGFMGSGKSSVGMYLAERISYQFKDTDKMIEHKVHSTISQVFSEHGEEYFRNLETDLLSELVPNLNRAVLSTGGGMPIREQNKALLKDLGYVVFLKASKQTTLNRLRGDSTRPLLQGDDQEKKIERMLELRTPIYEKTAHKIITTDGRSIPEISAMIMESYLKQIY